jgi:uncharacterized membrane protein YqhA
MRKNLEHVFESALWNFRFVILIAVIALLLSSLIAFYLGVMSTWTALMDILYPHGSSTEVANIVIVHLISSLDEFLLGIILIIIALGIYELFISKIDIMSEEEELPYPKWLTFHSMDELKAVLTKVIIIILMVYFFKSVVVMKFDQPLSILYLAVSIILIALANYISHKALPEHGEKKKGH